jgi:hypothetical protein
MHMVDWLFVQRINMKNENELDKQIKAIWKYPVYDGITNIGNYLNAKHKILWILKEPNKDRPRQIWNHRDFHNCDVSIYPDWKRTYQKIIYVSYGILNTVFEYNNIPPFDGLNSEINGKNILRDIAIININKRGGGSNAIQRTIDNSYSQNSMFIQKQIKLINADIIINASRVWQLFSDLSDEKSTCLQKINIQYKMNGSKIIINCYHPNARIGEELYCNSIF